MAAPMTSSEVLPAGISWAVTFSFGCAEFHWAPIALPQAISSGLFDSHTLIGPVEDWASLEPPPPPPQAAVTPRASTAAVTGRILDLMGDAPFVRCGVGVCQVVGAGPVDARTRRRAPGRSTGVAGRSLITSSRRVGAARPPAPTAVVPPGGGGGGGGGGSLFSDPVVGRPPRPALPRAGAPPP